MRSRINYLINSEGFRQSALVAVGNIGATGFSAISLIILSRFLGPVSFGAFSVAFSLTQLIARIGDFGFNLALQRYVAARVDANQTQAATAIQLVGKVKFLVILFSIGLGFLTGPYLASNVFHVSDPAMTTYGVCLASVILLYEYILTIVQALSKFALAVIMNASQAVLKFTMAIVSYFYLQPDPRFTYLWYGLAPIIASVIGFFSTISYFKKHPSPPSLWPTISQVAKFGAIAVLAAAIGDNIDVLMVNASLSEYETGLYSAASKIALMVAIFGASFGVVFNTRVAKYRNQADMNSFLKKASLFSLCSLLLIPIGLLLSQPFLLLTAGPQFLEATNSMYYLVASGCVMMAAIPYIAVFYAVDFPAYFAIAGVIQSVVLIGGNSVLIPLLGIEGAAIAKLITRIVVTGYTITAAYYYAHRQFNSWQPGIKE